MADKAKNVVLNFKMDGQVKYAETLTQINNVMNTAAKEYKNHIDAMGKDASATDKLRAEKKKLEIQMEGAQKRTKMLSGEFEAMSKDTNTTSNELNKMYGKLLNAENAEIKLKQSLERVNDGLSDQAQEAREAQQTLDKLKGESKLLEAEQKALTSSFKLQNAELGDNASESEKVELAQKQLAAQTKLTERTIVNLENQLSDTKKVYGENSIEVLQMESKLNDARTTIKKFSSSLDGIESSSKDAGDGLDDLGKKMDLNNLLEATELLQGVAGKLIEVGKAAFDSALQFGDSQTNLQANLGLTAEEAKKLNEVVIEVFKNGVVGSMEEATLAVALVKRTFKDLNDIELEKLTNNITIIAKRTGTDVQENVRGAEQMMINFGISGTKATDLISAGYVNGLNRSEDFMDVLAEFSPQFAQAGFSAEEMLNIINNGLVDGSFNATLAADAVKEFGIFLNDGQIKDNIDAFSKGTQDLFKQYEDGKATAAEVFASVSKDIASTNDKQKQFLMGTSAFGTMYEDMGVKAVKSFALTGGAIDNINGKADVMAEKSPGEKWESSIRELGTSLVPLGQSLTDLAIDVLPKVIGAFETLSGWFTSLPGPMQTFVTVFSVIIGIAIVLAPLILVVAAAFMSLNISLLPIIAIVLGIAAAIALIIVIIKNWGAITDWVGDKWIQFIAWLSKVVPKLAADFVIWIMNLKDGAINKFNELVVGGIAKFMGLKDGAFEVISALKTNAISKVNELKDEFVGKVTGLKDEAINRFTNLRDRAGEVMNAAKEKILSPIVEAKDKIMEIVNSITGFFTNMKLSIPKIDMPPLPHFSLSGAFSLKPPSVPKLSIDWYAKGGIMTTPTIFGRNGNNLMAGGEAGPEAVLPLNESTLGAIGKGIAETMSIGQGLVQHITIVSPDPTSPSENARAMKRASRQLALTGR